jgi:hypothetical protein
MVELLLLLELLPQLHQVLIQGGIRLGFCCCKLNKMAPLLCSCYQVTASLTLLPGSHPLAAYVGRRIIRMGPGTPDEQLTLYLPVAEAAITPPPPPPSGGPSMQCTC